MARAKPRDTNKPGADLAIIVLAAAAIACLLPFLGKAFHVDDPLFIWTAQHIRAHPLDPYGFNVNWYGTDMRMSHVAQNPPLACYYIALASLFVGWSEVGLHAFMMLPAVMAILGTYQLARRMSSSPLLAALIALLTPVFLISSTTVMCDVLMLAFWVWAMVLWLRGMENGRAVDLVGAAILIAAAALTKYFGAALVPLLLAYSLVKKRAIGWWALYMAIPVGLLALYQYVTRSMYGAGMLTAAAAYANTWRSLVHQRTPEKLLIGLTFTGGCLIPVLFYTLHVWTRRGTVIWLALFGAAAAMLVHLGKLGQFPLRDSSGLIAWSPLIQIGLFAVVGLAAVALAVALAARRRDAESILLGLWILGTILFAILANWTINARSILPAVPAIAIVLANAIDLRRKTDQHVSEVWKWVPLLPAAILAIWATYGDYVTANGWRANALAFCSDYKATNGRTYFQGHWGFQYYAAKAGAIAFDAHHGDLNTGDVIAMPIGGSNIFRLPEDRISRMESVVTPIASGMSTMSIQAGAGFYAEASGPLPFIVGETPSLVTEVAVVRKPFIVQYNVTESPRPLLRTPMILFNLFAAN